MKAKLELGKLEGIDLNLAKLYPISGLIDFRKTFWLLGATVGLSLLGAVVTVAPQTFFIDSNTNAFVSSGLRMLAFVLGTCWFVKFSYECLRRHCLYYGIDEGHLVISQGIVLKQRGFFPLSRITDIYLERSPLDLLFGLHTLHVSTPTSLSERFARIEGLNKETALALQHLLSAVLERAEDRTVSRPESSREREDYMPPVPSLNYASA